MRNIKFILEEIHTQANKDNCQSWNGITLNAMEQALKEQKEEIIEQLTRLSNDYHIVNGSNIISKKDLDYYIEKLELGF